MAIPDTPFHKKIRSDFKVFVYYIHQHLGLPDPTPVQLNMTDYLQHGPKRSIIQAFRGVGKSHLTAGYVVWRLLKDPETKILVVSASKERADAFSTFCQRLIWELEGLEYLKPRSEQRQSKISFDVGPSTASQSPSVKSVGITSQITGSRADLIVADDIEVLNNSGTQQMRDKLAETIKEFDAVLKPLPTSRVVFLGTPQTEDSLYAKLPERGYECRIWPARMPKEEEIDKYGESLAPFIKGLDLAPSAPTDPLRFQEEDLLEREASYGKAGFAMQFMLSTQLSDMERFPLKVRDLIVMSVDNEQGPLRLTWGPLEDRALNDLPNAAMRGDRMYPPMNVGDVVTDFSACVMSIDPSGRGADETGYAVVKMLNGFLYVVACGGLSGGYDDTTLTELSHIAKKFKVNEIVVESNFGDGMFIKLLQPVISKIHPVLIEEVRHSKQKERRIIDTLEPVMMRHKLVIDPKVIEEDFRTAQKYEQAVRFHKMLIYQMTRITTDKGSLKHDDRLDALSMAVGYYVEQMNRDEVAGESAHKQDLLDKELEKFIDNVDNPNKVSKPILSEGPIMFTEFR
tara:strand:- start:1753 stop:3462 length:1710 start_codon:yes stop_codon:yes gene_type:complete